MNEAATYKDFRTRALKLRRGLNPTVLVVAWEDCAWCATLADERILRALGTALAKHPVEERACYNCEERP